MERMVESVGDIEYHQYTHFLSESQWDWHQVNRITINEASELLSSHKQESRLPTGFIIDESSHLKKGKESAGVSRQYAGQIGKVDNCQVAVYASLVNDKYTTLVGSRLFLPEEWTSDKARMDKADISQSERQYKTKPELALELIDESLSQGVKFDCLRTQFGTNPCIRCSESVLYS